MASGQYAENIEKGHERILACLMLITVDFQLVVQKSRREFAHARNFLFKIPTNVRGFSSRFLDNQLEIDCSSVILWSELGAAYS